MCSMADFFCHHLLQLGPTADAGFLYGYVFFRQKKDPTIRRGYFQASYCHHNRKKKKMLWI